jgi:hypothetical protein
LPPGLFDSPELLSPYRQS